jgi:hypothetical protein
MKRKVTRSVGLAEGDKILEEVLRPNRSLSGRGKIRVIEELRRMLNALRRKLIARKT